MELALPDVAIITLCLAAVYLDLTRKKIPNYLTLSFMLAGLVYHAASGGFEGLWFSFSGLLAGIAMLFLPFAIGGMGGGDVKFLGAIGALQGAGFAFAALVLGVLLGGIMALAYLAIKGRLGRTLRRLFGFLLAPLFTAAGQGTGSSALLKLAAWFSPKAEKGEQKLFLPYGVPIAIGAIIVLSGVAAYLLPV